MFHREKPYGATLEERIDNWCASHFGRRLEPAARGILHYAVRRTLQLGDGGRVGPPGSVYRDFAEEREWERAAMAQPRRPGEEWDARAGRIAKAVTGKKAEGPPDMPPRRKGGVSL